MWLGALPVPTLGTKLDNEDSLWFGVPIFEYTSCVCGTNVDIFGTHGLSCWSSACRILRTAVNKMICRVLVSGVCLRFWSLWACAVMMVRGLLT